MAGWRRPRRCPTLSAMPTPAGWYSDPAGTPQQRYFDGTDWTEHYQPPPSAYERELLETAKAQRRAAERTSSNVRWLLWLALTPIVLALVVWVAWSVQHASF